MSLIREALDKARREAHDRDERGLYPGWDAAAPPRAFPWAWLVAAVAVALAVGVVLGVWMLRSGGAPETPAAATARAPVGRPPTAADGAAPPTAREQVREVATAPAAPSGGPASPPAPRRSAPVAVEEPAATEAEQAPPATPPAPAPAPQARPPSPERPAGGPAPGSSHLRQVTLPDGTILRLGGIAWSESSPAALVNGRAYAAGEGTDDWVLVAVERGGVELEWQGTRFFLRLK